MYTIKVSLMFHMADTYTENPQKLYNTNSKFMDGMNFLKDNECLGD